MTLITNIVLCFFIIILSYFTFKCILLREKLLTLDPFESHAVAQTAPAVSPTLAADRATAKMAEHGPVTRTRGTDCSESRGQPAAAEPDSVQFSRRGCVQ